MKANLLWAWENAKIYAAPMDLLEYWFYPLRFAWGFLYHFAECYIRKEYRTPNK